ncbi:MAG TPA: hypothetical protein VGP01_07230, partial [Rhizomicrobium sp.]|nr:hypothetical protein [Rhizomicrobium sp.]
VLSSSAVLTYLRTLRAAFCSRHKNPRARALPQFGWRSAGDLYALLSESGDNVSVGHGFRSLETMTTHPHTAMNGPTSMKTTMPQNAFGLSILVKGQKGARLSITPVFMVW